MKEQPVYGAGRVGIYFRQNSNYQYSLTDHTGSVRAVINRNKLSNGDADVVYYADYYPFGTVLRSGGAGGWRYGYQGEYAEKDGETGWNNFELRNYDAAIGRWLTTDPYGQYWSPYVGMGNNPILLVDADGGWASGDDPKAKVWNPSTPYYNDLPEASVTRKGLDILQRMSYRTEMGLDLFKFGDGRMDYAAKYAFELNQDYRNKLSAVWDPQKAIYDAVMFSAGGQLFNAGGKLAWQGGRYLFGRYAVGGMNNFQLLTRAAQKAESAIGGMGRFAGTAKHVYAKNLLSRYQSIYGDKGLSLGSNYFNTPAGRRFLDVVNHNTRIIYDFKFGNAVMSNAQNLKYSNSFPGYIIQVIRPF